MGRDRPLWDRMAAVDLERVELSARVPLLLGIRDRLAESSQEHS
jgi:hypothetical protein